MSRKLTQMELLGLAFEGVEARRVQNQQLKDVIVEMYKEELELQKAQESAQAVKSPDNNTQDAQIEQN